jgi:hypothetical protein
MALREKTAEWFERNAHSLSVAASMEAVLDSYSRSAR